MKFLLDTHVFLWFICGDSRLPTAWRDVIQQPVNEIYLSVVSLWETIIKHKLGKLILPEPPELYVPTQRERHRIIALTLDEPSVQQLATLPLIHRDPFDRMLISQAIRQGMTIISVDPVFQEYPAPLLDVPRSG